MNIQKLIPIIEDCATITIQIKDSYYDNRFDINRFTYSPSVRIQNRSSFYDLIELKEKYGGFITEHGTLTTWIWNNSMIKKYFPLIIPHLTGKTKQKAEIVLEASNCCHGRGKPQDKAKLKELHTRIKKLQAPRIIKSDHPF